jgi:flagellar motor switch protein FliM
VISTRPSQALLGKSLASTPNSAPARSSSRRGELPRARAALAAQRVSLRADLGTTVLTVGQVNDLAVGDVVMLDQRFDARVRLGTAGRQLAQGQLGVSGGHRALRIAPL